MKTLLTKRQAAATLAISTRSLERIIARGEIEVVEVGGAVRIAPDALAKFIAEQSERRGVAA